MRGSERARERAKARGRGRERERRQREGRRETVPACRGVQTSPPPAWDSTERGREIPHRLNQPVGLAVCLLRARGGGAGKGTPRSQHSAVDVNTVTGHVPRQQQLDRNTPRLKAIPRVTPRIKLGGGAFCRVGNPAIRGQIPTAIRRKSKSCDYGRQGRFCGPEGGQAVAKPPARHRILG
eukprot:COSAG03_NODE_725_length_6077_cov_23.498829_4_plen_180_part_00